MFAENLYVLRICSDPSSKTCLIFCANGPEDSFSLISVIFQGSADSRPITLLVYQSLFTRQL